MKLKELFNKPKLYKAKDFEMYIMASKTKVSRRTHPTPQEAKKEWEVSVLLDMNESLRRDLRKWWHEVT